MARSEAQGPRRKEWEDLEKMNMDLDIRECVNIQVVKKKENWQDRAFESQKSVLTKKAKGQWHHTNADERRPRAD